MTNFTTNSYEMKREIVNFSKKLSKGGSCLVSEIARSLDEKIK